MRQKMFKFHNLETSKEDKQEKYIHQNPMHHRLEGTGKWGVVQFCMIKKF